MTSYNMIHRVDFGINYSFDIGTYKVYFFFCLYYIKILQKLVFKNKNKTCVTKNDSEIRNLTRTVIIQPLISAIV